MSTIRARNGKLVFDFIYQGVRCRETTKLQDTPKDKKLAEEILSRIEAEILLGQFEYEKYFPKSKKFKTVASIHNKPEIGGSIKYADFYHIWFAENSGPWRPSTKTAIQTFMDKYILPKFSERPINSITKSDLLLFRNELINTLGKNKQKLGSNYINKIMMKCKVVLVDAAARFSFPDPSLGVKPLKKTRTKIFPLTLLEVQSFLSVIREDFKTYFHLRFFSGMRSSEVNALIWDDIDFKNNTVWVRRALVKNEIIDTKTEGSYRSIQLNHLVMKSLKQHKSKSKLKKRDDYVFLNSNDSFFSNDYVGKYIWHPMLRLLKLKPRSMYQTRHTTASIWLASGESPEWIAKQLGHTSTEMLFRTYSRYVPNMARNDGSLFDQYLSDSGMIQIYEGDSLNENN